MKRWEGGFAPIPNNQGLWSRSSVSKGAGGGAGGLWSKTSLSRRLSSGSGSEWFTLSDAAGYAYVVIVGSRLYLQGEVTLGTFLFFLLISVSIYTLSNNIDDQYIGGAILVY